jgi:hypothetical protein
VFEPYKEEGATSSTTNNKETDCLRHSGVFFTISPIIADASSFENYCREVLLNANPEEEISYKTSSRTLLGITEHTRRMKTSASSRGAESCGFKLFYGPFLDPNTGIFL